MSPTLQNAVVSGCTLLLMWSWPAAGLAGAPASHDSRKRNTSKEPWGNLALGARREGHRHKRKSPPE